MATKIIVLGQEEKQQTKKPIEFVKLISSNCKIDDIDLTCASHKPSFYKNIELICLDYTNNCDNYDLMFAYNDDRYSKTYSVLFLGRFNDGVVE